jgi:hypothetical protein
MVVRPRLDGVHHHPRLTYADLSILVNAWPAIAASSQPPANTESRGIVFLLLRIPLAQQYTGTHGSPAVPRHWRRSPRKSPHYSFWIGMLAVGAGGLVLCRSC